MDQRILAADPLAHTILRLLTPMLNQVRSRIELLPETFATLSVDKATCIDLQVQDSNSLRSKSSWNYGVCVSILVSRCGGTFVRSQICTFSNPLTGVFLGQYVIYGKIRRQTS